MVPMKKKKIPQIVPVSTTKVILEPFWLQGFPKVTDIKFNFTLQLGQILDNPLFTVPICCPEVSSSRHYVITGQF